MKMSVTEEFWRIFPAAQFGVVNTQNLDNTEIGLGKKRARLNASLEAGYVQGKKYLPKKILTENSVIKIWREAFANFPHEPNAISAVETLFSQTMLNNGTKSIDPLTDICSSISLIWALPITAFDSDRLKGDLRLGISIGGEMYITQNEETLQTQKNEICYFDDEGVVCGAWNWHCAKRTAINENTRNALLIINLVDPNRDRELKASLGTFGKIIASYLGGTVNSAILTQNNPSF